MTATERLRQLLDERGEHYETSGSKTWWGRPVDSRTGEPINVYHNQAQPMGEDRLFVELQLATPEQAVEATLGRGTCDMEFTQAAQFGDPNGEDSVFDVGMFRCTACGTETYGMWNDNDECREWPRYCPSCGRRVEP